MCTGRTEISHRKFRTQVSPGKIFVTHVLELVQCMIMKANDKQQALPMLINQLKMRRTMLIPYIIR